MKGIYTTPAISPYCKEITTNVEVVGWRGSRVLLRDLDIQSKLPAGTTYLIEADLADFQAVLPDAR